jgi:hypothetical protein
VSPGRADVTSPSLKSEPTPAARNGVNAAIGEPGEVERGVELCHDAVGDGL